MKRSKGYHCLLEMFPKVQVESMIENDGAKNTDGGDEGTQDEVTAEVKEMLEGSVEITNVTKDTEIKSPSCLNKEPSKVEPTNVKHDLEMVEHRIVQTTKSLYPGTNTDVAVPTVDIAINTTEIKDLFEREIAQSCVSRGVDPCFSTSPGVSLLTIGRKVRKISGEKLDKLRVSTSDPNHKERRREVTENIIAVYKKLQEQQKAAANAEDTHVDPKPQQIEDDETDEGANTPNETQPETSIFTKPYEVWGYVRDCMIYPILSIIRQEAKQAEQTEENNADFAEKDEVDEAKCEFEMDMPPDRSNRDVFSFSNIQRIFQSAGLIVSSIFSTQSNEDNFEYSDTDSDHENETRPDSRHSFGVLGVWRASGRLQLNPDAHTNINTDAKEFSKLPSISGIATQTEWMEALTEDEYINKVLGFETIVRPIKVEISPKITNDIEANKEIPSPQALDSSTKVQRDAMAAKPSLEKNLEEYEGKLHMIGMFSDGIRRTDLVLVMPIHLPAEHENIRMEFLAKLVKQGIQIEIEKAVLEENEKYQFVKLHATELCLYTYAQVLGLNKYFRDNNEEVVYNNRKMFWNRLLKREGEIRWLRRMRALQKNELHLSTLDRSYIVHIIVQHLRFGRRENYFGIHRLIQHKIFVDVYALHESVPYRSGRTKTVEEFTNRQVLCKKWFSWCNLLKDQPHHLIHEYFGSRIAFYFIFYELYNKALLIASIWGVFMTLIYIIKDPQYLKTTRIAKKPDGSAEKISGWLDHHVSHFQVSCAITDRLARDRSRFFIRIFACDEALIRDRRHMFLYPQQYGIPRPSEGHNKHKNGAFRVWLSQRSAVCAECEGEGKGKILCPYTAIVDYCFDLTLMRYFDSPYMIVHSIGIAILVQMMWRRWQHISVYWHWVWEEHEPELHTRPQHEPRKHKAAAIVRYIAFEMILPCFIFLIPIPLILLSVVGTYKYVRPLTVKDISGKHPNVTEMMTDNQEYNMALMVVDKKMEYILLVAIAAAVQIVLFVLEKIFHTILTIVTKLENHRTHANYERSLASKLLLVSLYYSSSMVIFYGWLKGTFYYSPLGQFDLIIETSTGKRYNMSELLPDALFTLIRRAMYLHCGPFSCFRQAVGAFFVTIMIRIVLVPVIGNLIRKRPKAMNKMDIRKGDKIIKHASQWVPTAELEKSLLPLTEERIVNDYNSLMLQVALVFLFTPLFPLAPLFALIVNYFDIRMKARSYLLHSRRALLHRRRGLGGWRNMFGLIAFAVPLFHGLTICKTEVFKKYVFYKAFNQPYFKPRATSDGYMAKDPNWNVEDMFTHFLLHMNYFFDYMEKIFQRFYLMNKKRLSDAKKSVSFQPSIDGSPVIYAFQEKYQVTDTGPFNFVYELSGCRMDGFFDYRLEAMDSVEWPLKWNYMSEKRSLNAMSQDHYQLLYVKTVFYICYLIFICFLSLILRSKMDVLYQSVKRRVYRQKILRRNRLQNVRFLASDRSYDSIKRAKTTELRIQK